MSSPSNRSTLWLAAVIVFFAMAALGWTLGRGEMTGEEEAADVNAKSNRSAATIAVAKARERANRARGKVSAIRRGGSPEQRMRATIELANTLSPDEFPKWMDGGWFDYRSGFELTLFRRIVEERWRAEDPEGFVAWCLEEGESGPAWATSKPKNSALPILNEWALNDPERLNAFFAKYPDDDLEAQLVSRLVKSHPAVALKRLKEILAHGGSGRYRVQAAVRDLVTKSPELAEDLLDELPASLRRQAEGALVAKRLEASFEDEIRALWERPDGWQLFSNSSHQIKNLSDNLLAELSNLPPAWRTGLANHSLFGLLYNGDPEPWFSADFAGAGFSEDQARRLRSTALSVLASKNPERAIALLQGADLDENVRRNVISNVFQNARSNPERAESFLAMLGSEADREAAQAVLDQAAQTTPPNQQHNTPEDWLEAVAATNPENNNRHQLGYALRQWSPEQMAALTEQFRELPAGEKDQVAQVITQASRHMQSGATSGLVGEAIRHLIATEQQAAPEEAPEAVQPADDPVAAVAVPRSSQATRLASSTAVSWVQQDSEAASTWVQSLPDGEAKAWAQRNMAAVWAQDDPAAMESWLGTLPAARQAEVREFLESQDR